MYKYFPTSPEITKFTSPLHYVLSLSSLSPSHFVHPHMHLCTPHAYPSTLPLILIIIPRPLTLFPIIGNSCSTWNLCLITRNPRSSPELINYLWKAFGSSFTLTHHHNLTHISPLAL